MSPGKLVPLGDIPHAEPANDDLREILEASVADTVVRRIARSRPYRIRNRELSFCRYCGAGRDRDHYRGCEFLAAQWYAKEVRR